MRLAVGAVRWGKARQGSQGEARRGGAWLGAARKGPAWRGMARWGKAWLGVARWGEARQGLHPSPQGPLVLGNGHSPVLSCDNQLPKELTPSL